MDIDFIKDIIRILLEKGILATGLLLTGYIISKSIERIKINEAFKNEITKHRVEKISRFYDLLYEYEHWLNRLMNHKYFEDSKNEVYLTEEELEDALTNYERIDKNIGFELNRMRFWINDDIYFHTVAQLELLKELRKTFLIEKKYDTMKDYRYNLDSIRMNLDKLISYLKTNQKLRKVNYDKSFLYK